MCGIAGRILPRPGKVGEDLVKLMHAQRHRGADSTGFALYGEPLDTGYVVRAMVAGRHELSQVLELFLDLLRAHGSDFLADPSWDDASTEHVSVRMVIREPKSLDDWIRQVDEHADRIEVQSVGRSLRSSRIWAVRLKWQRNTGCMISSAPMAWVTHGWRPSPRFHQPPVTRSGHDPSPTWRSYTTARSPIILPGGRGWNAKATAS
ncbi:MAG: hypothetical protein CM1200mP20_16070 [Pseudomonadota bacterium]|nr:MAG: hypothetical protein CM1200mP20_16070 [Pseudomonadota bacterium]